MKTAIAAVIAIAMVAGAASAQQHKRGSAKAASSAIESANVAAQLEQIEHKWADSEVKRDPAMIAPYLDATLRQTNPDGSVSNRQQVLEGIAKGDPTLTAVDVADMKTQTYGNAAVIMGSYTEKHEAKGKRTQTSGRFTDTYLRRDGNWKCVASHDSVAAKD